MDFHIVSSLTVSIMIFAFIYIANFAPYLKLICIDKHLTPISYSISTESWLWAFQVKSYYPFDIEVKRAKLIIAETHLSCLTCTFYFLKQTFMVFNKL